MSAATPVAYVRPSEWVDGPLEKGWLGGLKLFGKQTFVIKGYRCTSCGYPELYANWAGPGLRADAMSQRVGRSGLAETSSVSWQITPSGKRG